MTDMALQVAVDADPAVRSGRLFSTTVWLGDVHAGAERCQDQADGGRFCWIPVWERLLKNNRIFINTGFT
jgi:hypothetical protein